MAGREEGRVEEEWREKGRAEGRKENIDLMFVYYYHPHHDALFRS